MNVRVFGATGAGRRGRIAAGREQHPRGEAHRPLADAQSSWTSVRCLCESARECTPTARTGAGGGRTCAV
eukprot:286567-Prymnesium_polylepis.2